MTQIRKYSVLLKVIIFSASIFVIPSSISANNLPTLGDFSSSIVSIDTEHQLGQRFIRQIRRANQSINDPIIDSYIQDLVYDLVTTSQLSDRRIFPIVIGNLSINAFAAPGGVIGIHEGIILTAQSEAELASVISHEIAHLSQRHFAARVQQQRLNSPFSIASLLAGILVSVADPQAGLAVLSSSQASQLSASLAFSRSNEQEADRIGMLNLAKSGYDPNAMPNMFGRLLELQKLQGSLPPDFLLTHPTSNARIADSKNRAAKLGKGNRSKNILDLSIVQARLHAKNAQKKKLSLNHFRTQAKSKPSAVNLLTLALVAAKNSNFKEAMASFASLPKNWKNHLLVKLSIAEVNTKSRNLKHAIASLSKLNRIYPQHIAIQLLYAKALIAAQDPQNAIKQLQQVTEYAYENIDAWYLLAEAHGLAGNRNEIHTARIHYFLLKGQIPSAERQLSFARREQQLSQKALYKLDDLEEEIAIVKRYMNTRY